MKIYASPYKQEGVQQEKQPLRLSVSLSVESCIPYELNFFPCIRSLTGVRQHLREIEVNGVKLNHVLPCHNIGWSHVLLLPDHSS